MNKMISPSASRPAPNPLRRQRLLDAAENLFSNYGFRAVTMARIATEAGFAKATAYAYFASKDDVFRALAEDVARRLLNVVDEAILAPGTTTERLRRALTCKDALIYRLVTRSPHAGELFEARDRLARSAFDALDVAILSRVTALLDDGVERGLAPARLARIVVRASRGLATRAENVDMLMSDIETLVQRVVGTP
jgi:AcrR family transcriptional regulator